MRLNQTGAKEICNNNNGRLVKIDSVDKHEAIRSIIVACASKELVLFNYMITNCHFILAYIDQTMLVK